MEFTEEEVRSKLEELGYRDVPHSKLLQFMADLEELIQMDLSGGASSITDGDASRLNDMSMMGGDASRLEDTSTMGEDEKSRYSPLCDVSNRRKAFAKEKIKQASHRIPVGKENLSVFDSTATHESFSSSFTSPEHPVESQAKSHNLNTRRSSSSNMRRKVARKKDGSTRIFDESSTNDESELSDITALEESMRNLPVIDDDTKSVSGYSTSSSSHPKRRSKSCSTISSSTNACNTSLPAFIRPSNTHPHTKNLRKCDPVTRYQQFKKEWANNKFPGESSHSHIRWNIREQMLQCEVIEKPQHNHSVNNYVVPTEKKRLALRWQVRNAMARM